MADNETKMAPTENKMGVMPVKKLIVSMSLPMMLSMLVQALYNVVDSIFVSGVSENALTAVTLVFPMQNLMIALASGTGVGINALLSKALGEKNYEKVNKAANMGLLLQIVNYIIFAIIGLSISGVFIASQNKDPEIIKYGTEYMKIVSVLSFGCFFQLTLERLLQSTGKTTLSMISQMSGAIINIILDPIMIMGLFGFPRMEVAGAALATVVGQCCAAIIGLVLNLKYNTEIKYSIKEMFKPHGNTIKQIYIVGVPSMLMMSIGSVMTYSMNKILEGFSSTAQAVFGVYFKLQSFFFMPIFGLNGGIIPVTAFNYGARRKDRIIEALKFAIVLAVSIMAVGTIVFESIPGLLLKMFDASPEMLAIGVPAMRIIAVHFPVAAIAIILGSTFQAFSKSVYSLIVSLGRQLVVLIPVAWVLSLTGVLNNIWWAFPIAEIVSLILTLIFFRRLKSNIIDKL